MREFDDPADCGDLFYAGLQRLDNRLLRLWFLKSRLHRAKLSRAPRQMGHFGTSPPGGVIIK